MSVHGKRWKMMLAWAIPLAAVVIMCVGCGRESPQAQAVRRCVDTLAQGNAESRIAAAAELGRMRATNAVPALVSAVSDVRPDVRVVAVEALVLIGDARATEAFRGQLRSPEWRNRQLAAQGLGGLRDPSAISCLVEAMRDEHAAVAVSAAAAVAACGGLDELKRAAVSANESVGAREAALLILGESGGAGIEAITVAARDTNETMRAAAFGALAKTGSAREAPLLVEGLLDPSLAVRKASEKALLAMEPDFVLPSLTAIVETGRMERALAVVKLIESDHTACGLGVLAKALVNERASVRGAAERIFSQRKDRMRRANRDTRMLPADVLLKALAGTNEAVRAAAMIHIKEDAVLNRSAESALKAGLKDGCASVRLAAIQTLAGMKADGLAEALTQMLEDADAGVRVAAAMPLAATANETAVRILSEAVEESLRRNGGSGAVALIGALGASRSKAALPVLARALDSGEESTAMAAIRAVRDIGDKSLYDKLTPFLNKKGWLDREMRETAMEAMVALDPVRAAETLLPLFTGENSREFPDTLIRMCGFFGVLKEPRAAERMVDLLRERYADAGGRMAPLKIAAAAGLVALGEAAVPTLVRRLDDAKVREGALAMILGRIGEPARKPAIEALRHEDARVRKGAAWALGYMKPDPELTVALTALLDDGDQPVRAAAVWSLGQTRAKDTVSILVRMLASEEAGDRMAAAEALGRIGDVSAVPNLVGATKDTDVKVRMAAIVSLGLLGDKSAVGPLRDLLKDEKNQAVVVAANEALSGLDGGRREP